MKKLMTTAGLAAMLAAGAGGAYAAGDNAEIDLTATVGESCVIANAPVAAVTVSLTTPTLLNDGMTATCNIASNVTLTSANGALTLDGDEESIIIPDAPSNFDNHLDYVADVDTGPVSLATAADVSSTVDTVTGVFAATAVSAASAEVTITPVSGELLLAGTYTDTLTVDITPDI